VAHAHLKQILELLWPPGLPSRSHVWTILDGARDQRIYGAVQGCYQENCCLYAGNLAPALQLAAPYLVKLEKDDRFTNYVINRGWDENWGILLRSDAGMDKLRRHFRRFLVVKDHTGRRLVFRFYDPRVMRIYLPTCLTQELEVVFGPVSTYLMPGEEPETLTQFHIENNQLREKSFRLADQVTTHAGNP
jgi:hypothetical protein